MAGETQTSPPASELATEAGATSQAVVTGKPKSGKPSLADVLAKIDRGETLTHQDRGVLGASKRKAKRKLMPTEPSKNPLAETEPPGPPAAEPLPPMAPAIDNPLLEAATEAPAAPAAAAGPAVDSATCQMAADAILDAVDGGTKMWVGYECGKAKFAPNLTAQYESAVALHPRNRELMVKNSEPVILFLCKLLKCTPDQLPEALKKCGFAAGMIAHGMAVGAAIRSIRETAQEKPPTPQPAPTE